MASKSLILAGVGALVAGAVLVGYIAFSGSPSEPQDTNPKTNITETAAPKNEPNRTAATAETPQTPERNAVAPSTSATNAKGGVEGIVSDSNGKPVVAAKVRLRKTVANSAFGQTVIQAIKQKNAEKPEEYSTTSGGDGKYHLIAPPGDGWVLLANHSDYAQVEYSNITTPADSFFTFPITMTAGVRLYGRVTEHEKNMPIPGAKITLDGETSVGFAASMNEKRETATDESGTFGFNNLSPGRHTLTIKALTFGTKHFPVISVPAGEQGYRCDAVLMPGFNISGRVLDSNGHAVPNAHVRASTASIGGSSNEGITNENGEFVVTDLEEGRYYLDADAGPLGHGRPDPASTAIASGTVDVEIRLPPRCGVQGIVRDKATGQPLKNFTVEVRRGSSGAKIFPREIPAIRFADRRDGSFEVLGIDAAGQHILYVAADGYAATYSESFTVQPAQMTRGIDVALGIGGTVTGVILDGKTGQPVGGATIRTRDNDYKDISNVPLIGNLVGNNPPRSSDITVQSDAEGRFEIKHIDEGIIKLQITHPRFVTAWVSDVGIINAKTVDTGTTRLSSGSIVKGIVYAADGSPATNAEVKIQTAGSLGLAKGLFSKSVRCDTNGKYIIQNVPSGEYQIHAIPSAANGQAQSPFISMAIGQKTRKQLTVSDSVDQDVDFNLPPN